MDERHEPLLHEPPPTPPELVHVVPVCPHCGGMLRRDAGAPVETRRCDLHGLIEEPRYEWLDKGI